MKQYRFSGKILVVVGVTLAWGLVACDPEPSGPAGAADAAGSPDVAAADVLTPDVPVVVTPPGPAADKFIEEYTKVLQAAQAMSVATFIAAHTPADAAQPSALTYDPATATYFADIDAALALTAPEKERIAANGFMVSDRLRFPSFGEALLEVHAKDLPILITTDMILQALHASYDAILEQLEREVLFVTVDHVLAATHDALATLDVGGDPDALGALRDADLFVTVARSLLAGLTVPSKGGAGVDDQVADLMAGVAAEEMRTVEIFGTQRKMDFSQFKPRGHYEGDEVLERYFKAMMWLGRVDFRFMELDPYSGVWALNRRQIVAAHLLQQAVVAADQMSGWDRANDLITLMVGPVDYIDMRGVARMAADMGWASLAERVALGGVDGEAFTRDLLGGRWGEQMINSHWLETNPFSSEPTPLPPSYAFLGQRFVVDSYVFANVVYDNIVFEGAKVPRVLPDPLDALFVLGNDQVLPLLAPELAKFPYHANLHSLRYLVDYYEPEFWESNLYNLWLQALRALNAPTTGPQYPEPMRNTAWRDRVINTQLGSWAQLRHDTLLYAKQSYTGGASCEHPDGFVEPYPEFFGNLETLAAVAGQTLINVPFQSEWAATRLKDFFASWGAKMGELKVMAAKGLAGEAYTAEEIAMLKATINADPGCGEPVFSGWYSELFYDYNVADWKPTIADVHTNPNAGPLPGPNVLHVATGQVNLMVLTSETCEGPEAYVGPVFSYYEVDVPEIRRLADSEWKATLETGTPPARPEWTSSFLVSE
jgi:hypothetical protein